MSDAALVPLPADPSAIEQAADPGQYVVMACERAKAWLTDALAHGDIDRIVRSQGLCVSRDAVPGAISAVGTLRRVYTRSDGPNLSRTLRIIRDAYGDPGLEAPVIDGIGLLCQRYNGDLPEDVAVSKLASASGGVNGLLGRAENLRKQTGNYKSHCVAAAAVEIINTGKGGKKLPSWWKADAA